MGSRIIDYLSKKKIFGLPVDGVVKANTLSDGVTRLLEKEIGPLGRYIHRDENNLKIDSDERMIYNANIYIDGGYKVWFGDLFMDDETIEKLKKISNLSSKTLYVLNEFDGRFLVAPPSDEYLDSVARWVIKNNNVKKNTKHITLYALVNGKQYVVTISKKKQDKRAKLKNI